MTRIASIAASMLLAANACSQQPGTTGRALSDAVKQARLSLVEAVQKANTAVSGTVVHASLLTATKEHPHVAYDVHVLRDGKVFAVLVDAGNGAVGKAVELEPDKQAGGEPSPARQPVLGSTKIDFEGVAVGTLPTGWHAGETAGAGRPGTWRVEELVGASSGKHALRLRETRNSNETFNLVLSDAAYPADLDLAVRIHADAGDEDRGGGVVWRAKDADNYYLVRWNPLEDNLRAYKVVDGRRSMFKSVEVKADQAQWHALAIRAKGKTFEASFDGKVLLTVEDDTLPQPGRVGVWTKADAASSFDDLEVNVRQ